MDIKAIVCPNCGASAMNHHNCEYCGSFLVQRAKDGVDVSDFMKTSEKFVNESILQEVKKFVGLVQTYPNTYFSLSLDIKDQTVISIDSNYNLKDAYDDLEVPGICINLLPTEYEGILDEKSTERFKNSSLYNVFKKVSCFADDTRVPSEIPWDESQYYVDFGFDYKGAALVICQLLEEIVNINYEYARYDLRGGEGTIVSYSPENGKNVDFITFLKQWESINHINMTLLSTKKSI